MKILNSLIPLKFQNNEIYPSGLIFIGLGTHQTTGIGMHVYSHLIPTIERENLDLQDPYISKWNRELLSFIDLINSQIVTVTIMLKSAKWVLISFFQKQ